MGKGGGWRRKMQEEEAEEDGKSRRVIQHSFTLAAFFKVHKHVTSISIFIP